MAVDPRSYRDFQKQELEWAKASRGMRDMNFINPATGESYNKIIKKVPKALFTKLDSGDIRFAFQHPVNRKQMLYVDLSPYCLGWQNGRFNLRKSAGFADHIPFYDVLMDRDYKFTVHVTEDYREVDRFAMQADGIAEAFMKSQEAYRKEHLPKSEKPVESACQPESPFPDVTESDDRVQVLESRPLVTESNDGDAIMVDMDVLNDNESEKEDYGDN